MGVKVIFSIIIISMGISISIFMDRPAYASGLYNPSLMLTCLLIF